MLLLHGFGEFWWAWRHQLPVLDAAGVSVAALDLRGYGATDKTPRGYRQSVTGTDVSAVIRSLGFSSAYVVGHDWGGVAAWSTYAYAPEQVSGLATVAAPHPLRFPWRSMGPGLAWFQLPILPERVIMARDGAYVEWLLRRRTAPGSAFPSTADARHYRQALRLWPSPHCALEYLRMFGRDQLRAAGRDYRQALRTPVRVPVLTVRGCRGPAAAGVGDAAAGSVRADRSPARRGPRRRAPAARGGPGRRVGGAAGLAAVRGLIRSWAPAPSRSRPPRCRRPASRPPADGTRRPG